MSGGHKRPQDETWTPGDRKILTQLGPARGVSVIPHQVVQARPSEKVLVVHESVDSIPEGVDAGANSGIGNTEGVGREEGEDDGKLHLH